MAIVYGDMVPGAKQITGSDELGQGTPNPLAIARVQALNPNPFFQGSHVGAVAKSDEPYRGR